MKKSIHDYKNYIFDLDGTLYFHRPVQISMAFKLMFYYGFHFWKIKELLIISTYRKLRDSEKWTTQDYIEQEIFDELSKKYKKTPEQVSNIIEKWMIQKPLKNVTKNKDIRLAEFIRENKDKTIVIYSDFPTKKKLEALKIDVAHQFQSTDKNIECLKPNPKGLEYIIKQLKIKKDDTLLIGDRDSKDGAVARACGIDYLILNKSKSKRKNDKLD